MMIFLPFKERRMSSKLISKPAIITNRKTPNSEIVLISSVRCIKLRMVGPKMIPAIISPIIAGCLKRSKISPNTRAKTKRIRRFVKNGRLNCGKAISIFEVLN